MDNTKPFSIQAPEQIAKEYGGNKQMIAQAASSGLLDPTAAVLAGMFIDRMRNGGQGGPPQTVAQQVFSPQGQPPVQGLAALPQGQSQQPMPAQPQQAPMMGGMAPQQPQPQQPQGMSAGGLTTLSVPDAMFDEPSFGGYAGGGIVAFANGGLNDVSLERLGFTRKGDRYFSLATGHEVPKEVVDQRVAVASVPTDASMLQRFTGVGSSPYVGDPAAQSSTYQPPLGLASALGSLGQSLSNRVPDSVSRETSPDLRAQAMQAAQGMFAGPRPSSAVAPQASMMLQRGIAQLPAAQAATPPPMADTTIPVPQTGVAPDMSAIMQNLQGLTGAPGGPATDAYQAELQATPDRLAQEKKQDFWSTLAQIGFGAAGSNSPHPLQAFGQAASAALPGMQAATQARRAEQRQATKDLMGLEDKSHAEKIQTVQMALGQYDTAIKAANDAGQLQQAAQIANQRDAYERRAQDLGLIEHREENKTNLAIAAGHDAAGAAATRLQLSASQDAAIREAAAKSVDNRIGFDNTVTPEKRAQMVEQEVQLYKNTQDSGAMAGPETKVLNGVTYHKVNGQWMR